MAELAEAQKETQRSLKAFLDSMRHRETAPECRLHHPRNPRLIFPQNPPEPIRLFTERFA
jgi:hypothetical protein